MSLQLGGWVICLCLGLSRGPPGKADKRKLSYLKSTNIQHKGPPIHVYKEGRKLRPPVCCKCSLPFTAAMKYLFAKTGSHSRRTPGSKCATFAFLLSALTTGFRIDFIRVMICILKHIHSHKHLLVISILSLDERGNTSDYVCSAQRHLEEGQRRGGLSTTYFHGHMCLCVHVQDWV